VKPHLQTQQSRARAAMRRSPATNAAYRIRSTIGAGSAAKTSSGILAVLLLPLG